MINVFNARVAAIAYTAGWGIEDYETGQIIYDIWRKGTWYFGKVYRSHLSPPPEHERLEGKYCISRHQRKYLVKPTPRMTEDHAHKHILELLRNSSEIFNEKEYEC
jgi:hypothetical protein